MFAVARGHAVMAGVGLGALVVGFCVGHALGISSTLSARAAAMWQSPWENAARGGDSGLQALWRPRPEPGTAAVWVLAPRGICQLAIPIGPGCCR